MRSIKLHLPVYIPKIKVSIKNTV